MNFNNKNLSIYIHIFFSLAQSLCNHELSIVWCYHCCDDVFISVIGTDFISRRLFYFANDPILRIFRGFSRLSICKFWFIDQFTQLSFLKVFFISVRVLVVRSAQIIYNDAQAKRKLKLVSSSCFFQTEVLEFFNNWS